MTPFTQLKPAIQLKGKDMELVPEVIRGVLLKAREASLEAPVRTNDISIEDFNKETIGYHAYTLALDGCFITHLPPQPLCVVGTKEWPNDVIYGLTAKGHDRLAILEKDDLFQYIKEQSKEQGSSFIFSFGRDVASSWLKKKLGLSESNG